MTSEDNLFLSLPEQQRPLFVQEMSRYRKDEVIGVLLAVLLGWMGAHQFYLKRNGLGILYACFFWTGVPAIASLIDAFFMPSRVHRYNEELALLIYSRIVHGPALPVVPLGGFPQIIPAPPAAPLVIRACPHCGAEIQGVARFCPVCGAES